MDIILTAELAIFRSRRCDRVMNPVSHMMFSILQDRKAPRAILMPLGWTASSFLWFLSLADEYAEDPYSSVDKTSI
jgi:hypothetical protein